MTTDGQPSPSAPADAQRSRRIRNFLLIVTAFFVTMGAIVGGALFVFYDGPAGLDRSTPQASTVQFLDAALVERDSARVSLFVCDSWSAEEAIAKVAAPTDPRVSVSWGSNPTVRINGARATVALLVFFRVSVNGDVQEDTEAWTLHLEEQNGWRVCDLTKAGSLDP